MRLPLQIISFSFALLIVSQNAYAGAWILKRGEFWVRSSFHYLNTNERYYSRNTPCPLNENCTKAGQRVKFAFDGEGRVSALFLKARYGLFNSLELTLEVPYFNISFTDLADPERDNTTGIGDVRFGARYNILSQPIVTTFKVEAKAPTGFFNKDTEAVPIGDGQWDLEFEGRFGKSLWPLPGYVNLDLGYRFRFKPDEETSTLDPGDEFYFNGEAGYSLTRSFLLKMALRGLFGKKFKQTGVTIEDSEREILVLEPGFYWVVKGPLALESSVQVSMSGKNFFAGQVYSFGVSYTFSRR
ncbi:transporter [candidate division KSB1 bacterium]|nr:transporter [candidate division KSB1 bacterium]